jgi:hypothetical protein
METEVGGMTIPEKWQGYWDFDTGTCPICSGKGYVACGIYNAQEHCDICGGLGTANIPKLPEVGMLIGWEADDNHWMLLRPYEHPELKDKGILAYGIFHNPPEEIPHDATVPLLPPMAQLKAHGLTVNDGIKLLGLRNMRSVDGLFDYDFGDDFMLRLHPTSEDTTLYLFPPQHLAIDQSNLHIHDAKRQKFIELLAWKDVARV